MTHAAHGTCATFSVLIIFVSAMYAVIVYGSSIQLIVMMCKHLPVPDRHVCVPNVCMLSHLRSVDGSVQGLCSSIK